MEEPVRLVCPDCETVHRVKKIILGKTYDCKRCGGALRALEPLTLRCPACGAAAEQERLDPSNPPHCEVCADTPAMILPGEPEPPPEPSRPEAGPGDLARLPALIGELASRLDALRDRPISITSPEAGAVREEAAALRESLRQLSERLAETESVFLARLDEFRETQKVELAALLAPPESSAPASVEVDMDELAERLVAGVRGQAALLGPDSGAAVDALARVADELVREQSANSARVDALAGEIRTAVAGISRLDEWKGELPARVADEIGHAVEERVVGPISSALARQAPAILSDLQDHKLVDIVSRSVREAQRPLLREILAGGRGGIPVWLFASVLLPLLLILGYLFLPGEFGAGDGETRTAILDGIDRIRREGAPLNPAAEERLAGIEEVVLDIHAQALAHVKNAASLEQEVKGLKATIGERDRLIQEYNETLDKQMKRLASYERRLIQLGVSPNAVAAE